MCTYVCILGTYVSTLVYYNTAVRGLTDNQNNSRGHTMPEGGFGGYINKP